MTGYTLQVDELGKLIGDLETAADRMSDANTKLATTSLFGLLGNGTLADAGGAFEEAWEFGIEKLGEAAEGVTERLKTAKTKYQELEEQFGGGLDKLGETIPGGGYTGGIGDVLGGGR